MPRVVVTAHVADTVKWEAGFRTRGDLFRSETVTKPIAFGISEGNEVVVCFEPDDLEVFLKGLESSATADAIAVDGVKCETVKIYVMDKEFQP